MRIVRESSNVLIALEIERQAVFVARGRRYFPKSKAGLETLARIRKLNRERSDLSTFPRFLLKKVCEEEIFVDQPLCRKRTCSLSTLSCRSRLVCWAALGPQRFDLTCLCIG